MLLADYLLHHHSQVEGRLVLEVGAGTGLASIAASVAGARSVLLMATAGRCSHCTAHSTDQS